ncbi:hypothetical protein H7H73_11905, partial [Mycobacterium rufum]|nr:hypothetical protein [Mycolicibacterium rufum]
GPALEQFLGSSAGLSATTITRLTSQWQDEAKTFGERDLSGTDFTRLTSQWQDEAKTFGERDLSGTDYVYLWVDGIHLKVRLEQE